MMDKNILNCTIFVPMKDLMMDPSSLISELLYKLRKSYETDQIHAKYITKDGEAGIRIGVYYDERIVCSSL